MPSLKLVPGLLFRDTLGTFGSLLWSFFRRRVPGTGTSRLRPPSTSAESSLRQLLASCYGNRHRRHHHYHHHHRHHRRRRRHHHRTHCEVHKFVDDTTLSELITPSNSPSNMADYLTSLLTGTADNDMQLNTPKTKEMILGRIDSTCIPSLSTPVGPIQRVTTFKLLGLHLC